jgi:hypothetical protein
MNDLKRKSMQIRNPLKKKTKPLKAVFLYSKRVPTIQKNLKSDFSFFYTFYIEITLKNPIYKASFYLLANYYHAHDS